MKKTTFAYAIAFILTNSPEQLQIQSVEPISSILEFVQMAFQQPEAPSDAPKGRRGGAGTH